MWIRVYLRTAEGDVRVNQAEHFDSLGQLLQYPSKGFHDNLKALAKHLTESGSPGSSDVERFAAHVNDLPLEDCEELFTRTFDINPVCALEVGWQLYGESYERGNFIVSMRQGLKRFGLPESNELPDHLSHVLQAIGRMKEDQASHFIGVMALPAVKKMNAGLEGKDNPYRFVLSGILAELAARTTEPAPDVEGGKHG